MSDLTQEELSEFLAKRKDIDELIKRAVNYAVVRASRESVFDYESERDLGITSDYGELFIDIYERSSGKKEKIQIYLTPKPPASINDLLDFRSYLFNDHTEQIYINRAFHYEKYDQKAHRIQNIKKTTDGNTLEVVITGGIKTNKKIKDAGRRYHFNNIWEELPECRYRFYKYSGKCVEENKYKGETVTILFPDEKTCEEDLIKACPAFFRTMPLSGAVVRNEDTAIPEYSPLFFTDAPFIEIDVIEVEKNDPKDEKNKTTVKYTMPKLGETALIRSGIFAAFEAFAKDYPNIAYRYIPTGDFLTCFADLNRLNKKVINHGIFFKYCRIIPTDKGFISLEELLDSTKCDPNPPKYKLMYEDKSTLGSALAEFRKSLDKDPFYEHYDLKKKIGKVLLWDWYGDETKNLRINNVPSAAVSVDGYTTANSIEQGLFKEYIGKNHGNNRYVEITTSMFKHVRSTLFENPDEPAADDYVRAVLKEKRIDAKDLFKALQEKPWHNSFLNAGEPFSTILDDYIEELSQMSIQKDNNGEILTKPFMDFDGAEGFIELPQELKDKCRSRFDEDYFFEEYVIGDMSVNKIMKKAKYYDYKGNKTVYFWCSDDEDGHLVIFGEKAFERILELFEELTD